MLCICAQCRLNGLFHTILVIDQLSIGFVWKISIVHLALNEYLHTPRVRVRFIEVEVDATDVWGFENINTEAMRTNKPDGSRDCAHTTQLSRKDVLSPFQAEAPHDEFFGPCHLSVPERNRSFYRISAHGFRNA